MNLSFKDFSPRACKGSAATEFVPVKPVRLDLASAAEALRCSNSLSLHSETPRLLLLKHAHCSLSLFSTGRVLVKGARTEKEAKSALKALLKRIAKV